MTLTTRPCEDRRAANGLL